MNHTVKSSAPEPAAVYAAVAREIASATVVLSELVWEELHELYVMSRFWMRDERGASRLDMCSLKDQLAGGTILIDCRIHRTDLAILLWSGVMATVLELTPWQNSISFNEVGAMDPVTYLKP